MAELAGQTLLARAVETLSRQCEAVVVVGRSDAAVPCLPDRPRAGMGPLAGIAAALHHAAQHGFDAVLTTAVDSFGFDADSWPNCPAPPLPKPAGDRPLACQRGRRGRCPARRRASIRCGPLPLPRARGPLRSAAFPTISTPRRILPPRRSKPMGYERQADFGTPEVRSDTQVTLEIDGAPSPCRPAPP
jgi:hypothetical protein